MHQHKYMFNLVVRHWTLQNYSEQVWCLWTTWKSFWAFKENELNREDCLGSMQLFQKFQQIILTSVLDTKYQHTSITSSNFWTGNNSKGNTDWNAAIQRYQQIMTARIGVNLWVPSKNEEVLIWVNPICQIKYDSRTWK